MTCFVVDDDRSHGKFGSCFRGGTRTMKKYVVGTSVAASAVAADLPARLQRVAPVVRWLGRSGSANTTPAGCRTNLPLISCRSSATKVRFRPFLHSRPKQISIAQTRNRLQRGDDQ
jgi:hypothetical protein